LSIKIAVLSQFCNGNSLGEFQQPWKRFQRETYRSNLSSESISVSAARDLVPTPVVTRSGEVRRTEMTSNTVLGSQISAPLDEEPLEKPVERPDSVNKFVPTDKPEKS